MIKGQSTYFDPSRSVGHPLLVARGGRQRDGSGGQVVVWRWKTAGGIDLTQTQPSTSARA
jgi:hypothetical protein